MRSDQKATAMGLAALLIVFTGVWSAAAKESPRRSAGAQRGYMLAGIECARCHAIEGRGESPNLGAPPFREIRRRYNELSLAREFEAISKVGHYEMPATPISKSDGQDLISYIESLNR